MVEYLRLMSERMDGIGCEGALMIGLVVMKKKLDGLSGELLKTVGQFLEEKRREDQMGFSQ